MRPLFWLAPPRRCGCCAMLLSRTRHKANDRACRKSGLRFSVRMRDRGNDQASSREEVSPRTGLCPVRARAAGRLKGRAARLFQWLSHFRKQGRILCAGRRRRSPPRPEVDRPLTHNMRRCPMAMIAALESPPQALTLAMGPSTQLAECPTTARRPTARSPPKIFRRRCQWLSLETADARPLDQGSAPRAPPHPTSSFASKNR